MILVEVGVGFEDVGVAGDVDGGGGGVAVGVGLEVEVEAEVVLAEAGVQVAMCGKAPYCGYCSTLILLCIPVLYRSGKKTIPPYFKWPYLWHLLSYNTQKKFFLFRRCARFRKKK